MTIVVRVAGERDVVTILELDESFHRVSRRRIEADLAVPVERHERELRVDFVADDIELDRVAFRDARPVMHAGAAQRVHAHADAGTADHIEVEHAAEIVDIRVEIIVLASVARRARSNGMRGTAVTPVSSSALA